MREMIISELSEALQEIARGFAHFLPRLLVMLVFAVLGWIIAYIAKVVLRSVLRLVKFDKLSENAGASQLLSKAALPSATELLSRSLNTASTAGRNPSSMRLLKWTCWGFLACRSKSQNSFCSCRVYSQRWSLCFSDFWQPVFFLALPCWLRSMRMCLHLES